MSWWYYNKIKIFTTHGGFGPRATSLIRSVVAPNRLQEQEPAVLEELLLLFRQLVEASDGLVGEP